MEGLNESSSQEVFTFLKKIFSRQAELYGYGDIETLVNEAAVIQVVVSKEKPWVKLLYRHKNGFLINLLIHNEAEVNEVEIREKFADILTRTKNNPLPIEVIERVLSVNNLKIMAEGDTYSFEMSNVDNPVKGLFFSHQY